MHCSDHYMTVCLHIDTSFAIAGQGRNIMRCGLLNACAITTKMESNKPNGRGLIAGCKTENVALF